MTGLGQRCVPLVWEAGPAGANWMVSHWPGPIGPLVLLPIPMSNVECWITMGNGSSMTAHMIITGSFVKQVNEI